MQATSTGTNRTGTKVSPMGVQAMTDAVQEYTPMTSIDTAALEDERLVYINASDAVGSIPPPLSVKGVVKSGLAKLKGAHPTLFFDKIGERIAFERSGARLYEALIVKFQSIESEIAEMLPPAYEVLAGNTATSVSRSSRSALESELPGETLVRIHTEELAHFKMLCEVMQNLGGDPTAQTPCADVTATASMGMVQVLTDPRTTFAQCLNTMLTAELADNAGWEMLIRMAEDAEEEDLSRRFRMALAEEEEHLAIVKGWLVALMANGAGTPAV
ncbi:uncharacterized protein NMK_1175 [Novimethylophilus kurashikiensis]|uniref:Uncharacterized protein n=1 Tax=Novimethylophilus kurashikiensis TaxID=1825523 RepID=A0A2R5FAF7_9PROT|nr:ferritin-like domain-containing protein [Novimethylophilus kurashikiensis]GBG13624.1 uncharacterized protein NMK_1175 [Novimethylophilus kurashikiensis]